MTIDSFATGGPGPATNGAQKTIDTELVVFDFDETVVSCNSDTFINQLAPDGTIPQEIWNRFLDERDWTAYMQQVFNYLHKNNVKEADYDRCLNSMPFVDGMPELLEFIRSHQNSSTKRFEAIIISDANTYFIGHFLRHYKMEQIFRKIYTNPAHFDKDGCLQIQRYHVQDFCKLSAVNMCKGQLLKEFVAQRKSEGCNYSRLNYIGDGQNDYCPSLTLQSNDRVFPRSGFKLHHCIKTTNAIKAQVHPFVSGQDILKVLSFSR